MCTAIVEINVLCSLYAIDLMASVSISASIWLYTHTYGDMERNSEHQVLLCFPFLMKLALPPWQEKALLTLWFGLDFANSLEIFTINRWFSPSNPSGAARVIRSEHLLCTQREGTADKPLWLFTGSKRPPGQNLIWIVYKTPRSPMQGTLL